MRKLIRSLDVPWLLVVVLMLIIMAALSCASVTRGTHSYSPEYRVTNHALYQRYAEWENSRWHKARDPLGMTPVYLLVGDNRYGCIVTPLEWNQAQLNQPWACRTGWRLPRRD